jgi:ribosome-associated heat shock protein Hsp15
MADISVRLDKWLWAARFFKTRSLATDAIKGGKVHVNGERAKPGKDARIGMELRIRTEGAEFEIIITGISAQRGPAAMAAQLYQETEASKQQRAAQQELRRQQAIIFGEHKGRPTKKDRRNIVRFIRKNISS